jgi:hypothetical protein
MGVSMAVQNYLLLFIYIYLTYYIMVPFIRLEKYSGSNQVSCRGLALTKVSSKMKPLKQLRTILWSLKKATIVPIGQSNQSDQRAWMISGF